MSIALYLVLASTGWMLILAAILSKYGSIVHCTVYGCRLHNIVAAVLSVASKATSLQIVKIDSSPSHRTQLAFVAGSFEPERGTTYFNMILALLALPVS